MNWLWFIPILLVMVVIHEMGHFLTARYFGMKVHEFGIGFPPKVWSRKTKDGMEWSINALPIGGFVRIEGENGDSDDPNAFGKKPPWQRAIVLVAGPTMNLILALVLYFVVSVGGGKEIENGRPAALDVLPNSPAALAGLQTGDIFVSANGKPVKAISDIQIETALDKNNAVQLVMERNGQTYNTSVMPRKNPPEGEGAMGITLGNAVGPNEIMLGNTYNLNKELGLEGDQVLSDRDRIISVDGQTFPTNLAVINYIRNANRDKLSLVVRHNGQDRTVEVPVKVQVEIVYKDSGAAKQGLTQGAIITRMDDQLISNRAQYEQYLTANAGKEIKLYYKSNSQSAEKSLILLANAGSDNKAPRVINGAFAIIRPTSHISYNPVEAAGDAWDQTIFAVTLVPRTLKGLFDGSVPVSSLAGPVGMAQITDTVVTRGAEGGIGGLLRTLALLTAMLSVNLGVFNILPLPALDGGRLIFVLIEMVTRGKRVPPEKESFVHFAGMIALLSLMVLIGWQDIVRLISGATLQ